MSRTKYILLIFINAVGILAHASYILLIISDTIPNYLLVGILIIVFPIGLVGLVDLKSRFNFPAPYIASVVALTGFSVLFPLFLSLFHVKHELSGGGGAFIYGALTFTLASMSALIVKYIVGKINDLEKSH